jgi:hypothetical protein
MGRTSNDPTIKKNAVRTIKLLKRIGSGCAVPQPLLVGMSFTNYFSSR